MISCTVHTNYEKIVNEKVIIIYINFFNFLNFLPRTVFYIYPHSAYTPYPKLNLLLLTSEKEESMNWKTINQQLAITLSSLTLNPHQICLNLLSLSFGFLWPFGRCVKSHSLVPELGLGVKLPFLLQKLTTVFSSVSELNPSLSIYQIHNFSIYWFGPKHSLHWSTNFDIAI